MNIEIGSFWSVRIPAEGVVVVLSGPFGDATDQEFLVAPLYANTIYGRTPDVVAVATGAGAGYAALWNTRPAVAGDLEHQLGQLSTAETGELVRSYWNWLQEDERDPLKALKTPWSRRRARKFRQKELARWAPLSDAALARRYRVVPATLPSSSTPIPAQTLNRAVGLFSDLCVTFSGPDPWQAALPNLIDVATTGLVGNIRVEVEEQIVPTLPYLIVSDREILFKLSTGAQYSSISQKLRATMEARALYRAFGLSSVGTVLKDCGLIQVDALSLAEGQRSRIGQDRLAGKFEAA